MYAHDQGECCPQTVACDIHPGVCRRGGVPGVLQTHRDRIPHVIEPTIHPPRLMRYGLCDGTEVLKPLMLGISPADRNYRNIILACHDTPIAILGNDYLG